ADFRGGRLLLPVDCSGVQQGNKRCFREGEKPGEFRGRAGLRIRPIVEPVLRDGFQHANKRRQLGLAAGDTELEVSHHDLLLNLSRGSIIEKKKQNQTLCLQNNHGVQKGDAAPSTPRAHIDLRYETYISARRSAEIGSPRASRVMISSRGASNELSWSRCV